MDTVTIYFYFKLFFLNILILVIKPESVSKPVLSRQAATPAGGAKPAYCPDIDAGPADFYEECGDVNGTSERSPASSSDTLPVLGTCTALYPFEGNLDGATIAMKIDDEMILLERDQGDGWTRVRNVQTQVSVFVCVLYVFFHKF